MYVCMYVMYACILALSHTSRNEGEGGRLRGMLITNIHVI